MDDQTLPKRLRELAQRTRSREHSTAVAETAEMLEGAADELERLAHDLDAAERGRDFYSERLATAVLEGPQLLEPPALGHIDAGDVLYALRYGLEVPDYVGTAHDLEMRRHALRLVAGAVREAHPARTVADELVGCAGVAEPRRFRVFYAEGWAWPSPGAFVFLGPALATWRVLSATAEEAGDGEVLEVVGGGEGAARLPVVLEVERVAAHDVPVAARLDQVPLPAYELEAAGS